jgi:hypothetical protein
MSILCIWSMQITKYTLDGSSACFISNRLDDRDANATLDGTTHVVPAWSVSILPDCKTVVYNTGKVVSNHYRCSVANFEIYC